MMDFEAVNYFEFCGTLDRLGLSFKILAAEAQVKTPNHVWITLRRYCGKPKPRGPQSPEVCRILNVAAAHYLSAHRYPPATADTYGSEIIHEQNNEEILSPRVAGSST